MCAFKLENLFYTKILNSITNLILLLFLCIHNLFMVRIYRRGLISCITILVITTVNY